MLENLMPKESGPAAAYTVIEPLKTYATKYWGLWRSVKYRAHTDNFDKILWEGMWSKETLKELREDYLQRGLPEQYSQEFLNIPVDPNTAFFRRGDFQAESAEDKKKQLNYYIAGDFAISEKERADYTVFVVGGMDDVGTLHIRNVIRGRMDGEEIINTMLGLQKVYNPLAFGIEEMQVSKALGPYLNRAMVESNTFINLYLMKPDRKDKTTRAQSIRARMRAGGVKFDKGADWYATLEDECLMFPRSRHDDQVDSLAYLGLLLDKIIDAPTQQEIDEQDYLDELEKDGSFDDGRNNDTGY